MFSLCFRSSQCHPSGEHTLCIMSRAFWDVPGAVKGPWWALRDTRPISWTQATSQAATSSLPWLFSNSSPLRTLPFLSQTLPSHSSCTRLVPLFAEGSTWAAWILGSFSLLMLFLATPHCSCWGVTGDWRGRAIANSRWIILTGGPGAKRVGGCTGRKKNDIRAESTAESSISHWTLGRGCPLWEGHVYGGLWGVVGIWEETWENSGTYHLRGCSSSIVWE